MQIKLADPGPTMWFLGKPGNVKVSLNFANPGPVEVDFENLDTEDQKKILLDLQGLNIETDETFENLHKLWMSKEYAYVASEQPVVIEPQVQIVDQPIQQPKPQVVQEDKALSAYARFDKSERQFQDRIEYLSTQGFRALRSALKYDDNPRLFRTLLAREKEKDNPRKMVVDFLEEKLVKLSMTLVKNIDKPKKKPKQASNGKLIFTPRDPSITSYKGKTIAYDVEESEQEIVQFSQEELIQFASGVPTPD